jgi:nucleotide-binding universal stress UspA family protein
MIPIRHILVPTDFSEPAEAALRWAVTVAREFDSRVHLLHVVPEPFVYPWGTELSTLPLGPILAQAQEAASTRLVQIAAATGLPADRIATRVAVGTPVDQVLTAVRDEHIDLVIMGTHGRGPVSHLLLGSVAERVVRRSEVPVLTVHGAPGAAAAGAAAAS